MHHLDFNRPQTIFNLTIGLVLLVALLTGCGGEIPSTRTPSATSAPARATDPTSDTPSAAEPTSFAGSADAGQQVFTGAGACSSCHTVNGSGGLIGPDLVGAAASAASIHPDLPVEEALKIEIIDPNLHITEGYRGDLMPQNYEDTLTEQQLQDLVAYMMSLN